MYRRPVLTKQDEREDNLVRHGRNLMAKRSAEADLLFLSEAETARRLGKSLSEWQGIATILERDGFPKADPLFDGRRYWPAVQAFFHRRYVLHSIGTAGQLRPDGEENLDVI